MSGGENKTQRLLVTYFPMFIATLSLCAAIFNAYLNMKFVDLIQRNLGRAEYMRTCKEIIDAYFQVKFRAGIVNASAARGADAVTLARDEMDGANAVSKFAALGTYLANLRNEDIRRQYTALSDELSKAVARAKLAAPGDMDGLFVTADEMFTGLNNDCVKSAQDAM
ncbi:MAG TPA: hypothetical protein VNL39_15655 [Xanthobacteraceae bacterium]|nr:hypothetical protein [Xanthobacteraceae bacterium]